MTESQFLMWILAGAGALITMLVTIVGFFTVRSLESFREAVNAVREELRASVSGVRDDFREKCDEVTDELRIISKRVTDNSEAMSGRLADIDRRVVRLETICEGCRDGSTH